ncbi:MAG: YitT family protein [Oscillospiraceae bacterium]
MRKKEILVDIFWEIIGSFLVAAALYNFALFAEFPMTGFSGIALILYRLFGLPIGLTTILLNIPVAILCYRLIGRSFLLKSLRCMALSSLMIDWVAPMLPTYQGSRMLAAIVTGVLGGIGYAVIYMRKSSTGGSDFIIMAAKAVKPHIRLGTIAFLSDIGIILAGGIIFQDIDGIIYGMIINFLFAVVVDKTMCGLNSGKIGLIVTEFGAEMCQLIDACSGRGSTILYGRGGYKQNRKQVVMVACSAREMYLIEQAVKNRDDEVFMVVMDSNEVHGEGFRVIR